MDRKASSITKLKEKRRSNEKVTHQKSKGNQKTTDSRRESASSKKAPKEIIVKRANKSTSDLPKQNRNSQETDEMYAAGGYAKAPNPKQLSKPNLTSPSKKKISSPTKSDNPSKNVLISPVENGQTISTPLMRSSSSGSTNYHAPNMESPNSETAYLPNSHLTSRSENDWTIEQANRDLRNMLNIK